MQHEQMLEIYREIENISLEMEGVVRVGNWEALIEMEAQVSARVVSIQSAGGFSNSLSAKERESSAALITRILNVQQGVRQTIQEKVADLTSIMTTSSVEQRLSSAYGVPPRT